MRRKLLASILVGSLLLAGATSSPPNTLTDEQRALHVLNRLGFGPKPGDVERVVATGIDRYIAQQLQPERIDDRAVESSVARYQTLALSNRQLVDTYLRPEMEARRRSVRDDAARPEESMQREGRPRAERPRRVIFELSAARIERAIHSNRQLNEVMVDFWMNHFNVFAGKGLDRVLIVSHERDAIRPNLWGKFEDLLLATAKSPAMLFYLDNARSVAPPEARGAAPFAGRRGGGLNENYARELLELHTVGVDGGYSQKDVTELARLLTGWGISRPGEGELEFVFRAGLHDRGSKTVMGQHFAPGGGIDEGERFIRFLATHPSTARHIATKLCQRLVADEPPPALVDRVAKRFLATRGDLRETVRAIVTSREFFDPRHYRAKVKTPFEYVVSAVRATGSTTTNALGLARALRDLGEPLYFSQPPTGYSDAAEDWVSSGALVNRLNFAMSLAASSVPGTRTVIQPPEGDPVSAIAAAYLGGDVSESTRRTIDQKLSTESTAATPDKRLQLVAGLILGSPEFQRQ